MKLTYILPHIFYIYLSFVSFKELKLVFSRLLIRFPHTIQTLNKRFTAELEKYFCYAVGSKIMNYSQFEWQTSQKSVEFS